MTEAQMITIMFAAPFLALSIAWAVGLAALEYNERRSLRKLRKMVEEDRK